MGTNFYLRTQDRQFGKDFRKLGGWFSDVVQLVDEPDFCYEIHIAKTSCGWLPLFQSSPVVSSVKDIKTLYDGYSCKIFDEYNREYTWEEFKERVLEFNGGVASVQKTRKETSWNGRTERVPISHFEYMDGRFANHYFKDSEGYEFSIDCFS